MHTYIFLENKCELSNVTEENCVNQNIRQVVAKHRLGHRICGNKVAEIVNMYTVKIYSKNL